MQDNVGAGVSPNVTAVAPARFWPLSVTIVPPRLGPKAGVSPVTTGAAGFPADPVTAMVALKLVPRTATLRSLLIVPTTRAVTGTSGHSEGTAVGGCAGGNEWCVDQAGDRDRLRHVGTDDDRPEVQPRRLELVGLLGRDGLLVVVARLERRMVGVSRVRRPDSGVSTGKTRALKVAVPSLFGLRSP